MAIKRTNRGASIDIDALISSSKANSPALGNMKINAKGDKLGPNGEIVQRSEDRVREYYKNNPRSSTAKTSLKGQVSDSPVEDPVQEIKTAKTAKQQQTAKTSKKAPIAPDPVAEPEEFDAPQEPVSYKEVELPNGDIEMVAVYKDEQ